MSFFADDDADGIDVESFLLHDQSLAKVADDIAYLRKR